VLPGATQAAWTTNEASLDPGQCGRNLQSGSDRTASVTAMPTFLLQGDGGLSTYAVAIDGQGIGTFASRGDAVVCIATRLPLAEGSHVLTGTELAPNPGTVVRLAFSVDTRAPRPPSRPTLSAYTDTGVRGDGITAARSVNMQGKAGPNESIQITVDGRTVVAGATADAKGRWSATTVPLNAGSYLLAAVSLDRAGNRSAPSAAARITIQG